MRKKILSMSIAAVMTAITSSGVMAFDTNGCPSCDFNGPIRAPEVTTSYEEILKNRLKNDFPGFTDAQVATKISRIKNLKKLAGYQGNWLPQINGTLANTINPHPPVQSIANLTLSSNNLGDALIFPMFNQAEDWGTEIVVRNTDQEHAIVAKVAVYAADKSEEVLDFNVYLSAADVVRFKIENGYLTSTDGSVVRIAPTPSSNVDDVHRSGFASEASPFSHPISVNSGYVVVYGMAQASTDADPVDRFDMRYHNDHRRLFRNYRSELDICRPGWRIGHQNSMVNGTYTRHTRASQSIENYSIAAPNQATNCTFTSTSPLFGSVKNAGLTAIIASNLSSQITDAASAIAAANAATAAANAAALVASEAATANNSAAVAAQTAATMASMQAALATAAATGNPAPSTAAEFHAITIAVNNTAISVASAAAGVSSAATASAPGNFFGDVDASLTGTVRLFNASNGARDMILPATAIENFTSGNKIIYTEGEIAALQDRKIKGTMDHDFDYNAVTPEVNMEWAKYNELAIRADARALMVNNLSYNFADASVANQLVITQPYKRVLVQLGNDDGYWQDADVGMDIGANSYWADSDDNYGGFSFLYNVYDEHENIDPAAYSESPHNSGIFILRKELQIMANLEEASTASFFNNRGELGVNAEKNGFALFGFTNMNGLKSGIPAVVTQMIGTTVGGTPQVNWIYSQTQKNQH